MPEVKYHMKDGKIVLGDAPDRVLDYHNNNLVSDLDHLMKDTTTLLYTDWELLCAVAKIVDKRRAPSSEMTDCQTGLCYRQKSESIYKQAMEIAQHNAGKEQS